MSDLQAYVIPDSIQPFVGWKALSIDKFGYLCSPQQKTVWPVQKRLEASCSTHKPKYHWTVVPQEQAFGQTALSGRHYIALNSGVISPPPPQTQLPEGLVWFWTEKPHEIVSKDCRCGIYAVKDIRDAAAYLKQGAVLAEVALWGRVVPGTQGARGQYAYPQQLFTTDLLTDVATLVAELYKVPIGYRCHKTGKVLDYEQASDNLALFKEQLEQIKSEQLRKEREALAARLPAPVTPPLQVTSVVPLPSPPKESTQPELRTMARVFAKLCAGAILVIMLLAILFSPYLIPLALPLIWGFALGYRDGWPGLLNNRDG